MKPIDISLILALYNEGPILTRNLFTIEKILFDSGLSFEIIIIDDNSKDDSLVQAKLFTKGKENYSLIAHEKNVGRGGTVNEGIFRARGRAVGFLDIDLENSPDRLLEAIRLILNNQADIVTGLRVYRFEPRAAIRYLANKTYKFLVKIFLSLPLKDTESGFKFFNREKILPLLRKVKDKGWFWDTEIMALGHRDHLKIMEIPVIFKRCFDKKSTVKIFKDSVEYLIKLIAFRFRKG